MPSTHLSLHFHLIFSTNDRIAFIEESWRDRLFAYIGGTIRTINAIPESIGGMADHVHILAGLKATHKLADLMREIKHSSSNWVHQTIGLPDFSWQKGYGAFSVSVSQIEMVKSYISRQQEHHQRRTFEQEYLEFLKVNKVEYGERYLW